MTTYHMDTAGSNTAPYDTWAKAATALQTLADLATAGDTVYCRGTQTLAAAIDIDINNGDETNGMISFIGCNAAGVNDGTYFVLDGNNAAANCINANNIDHVRLENFEAKNATGHGINSSNSCQYWMFNKVSSHNNGDCGINGQNFHKALFVRCAVYSNTDDAFNYLGADSLLLFSALHDNTDDGVYVLLSNVVVIGSLIYDNGDTGISLFGQGSLVFNCAINGNTHDGIASYSAAGSGSGFVIGTRITNHPGAGDIGLNANGEIVLHGWNYYEDNDGNNIQNNTLALEILNDGAGTDQEDQADTNEGYTDKTDGAEDFNLRSDATARRTAVTIPVA